MRERLKVFTKKFIEAFMTVHDRIHKTLIKAFIEEFMTEFLIVHDKIHDSVN